MQGRHQTSVWTIAAWIARGPGSGDVAHSRVGPKMATTGTSTAAARCIAPESFETNARHRDSTPASAGRSVLPARSIIAPAPAPAARAVAHDGVDRVAIGGSADDHDARAGLMRQAGGKRAHPLRRPPLRPAVRRAGRDADEGPAVPPVFAQQAVRSGAALVVHPHLGNERARRDPEPTREVLVVLGLVQARDPAVSARRA